VTGLFADQDYRATVEMALRLHPAAKQVFVVLNTPGADQSIAAGVARQRQLGRLGAVSSRVPTPTLIATLNSAPADSIVLYVRQPENSDGRPVPIPRGVGRSGAAVHYPSTVAPYTGSGIISGKVFDPDECSAIVGGWRSGWQPYAPVDVPQRGIDLV
jgi:hypothetical protein